MPGTVYLLHFARPFKHAGHYLGWSEDVPRRLAEHGTPEGSALMRAVAGAGIGWELVRIWRGRQKLERALKRAHGSGWYCPLCRPALVAAARERMRRLRQSTATQE